MSNATNCPKCAAEMEDGFIIDFTHGNRLVSTWIEGEPKSSFWTGVVINRGQQYPVQSFRCTACGFLESYARKREKQPRSGASS
jgi:predicted nucleic-acid-binding Zn-ribbon protein